MSDSYQFPVDLTSIMVFASSLGETNPVYYDEEYAKKTDLGGVIAPPTFAMASSHWNPKYPLRGVRRIPAPPPKAEVKEDAPKPEGGGGGEGGGLTRLLHGAQSFEYHQPIRPGMRLTVTARPGRSWEKEGRRGGRLRFTETITEYRDEGGDLVVTAIGVGVVTGKAVEG